MEYLNKVLGIEVTYEDVEFKHLPNFIVTRYRLQMASMNGKKVIFLYPKTELEQIEVLKKHIARIQKNENKPIAGTVQCRKGATRRNVSIGADASVAFHLWRRTRIVHKSGCERLGINTYFYIESIETA